MLYLTRHKLRLYCSALVVVMSDINLSMNACCHNAMMIASAAPT